MKRYKGVVNLGIFQFTPVPNAPAANLEKVRLAVHDLARKGSDIILLPELWVTGPIAHGVTIALDEITKVKLGIQALASKLSVIIVGGMPELCEDADGNGLYDTTYVFGPEGPCRVSIQEAALLARGLERARLSISDSTGTLTSTSVTGYALQAFHTPSEKASPLRPPFSRTIILYCTGAGRKPVSSDNIH